jgi:hypothetical protein
MKRYAWFAAVLTVLAVWGSGRKCLAGAAAEAAQEEPDVIQRTDQDRPMNLNNNGITRDDYLFVEGRQKGSTVKLESYKVKDILRGDRPTEYNSALDRKRDGRYTVAAKWFTDALKSPALKDKAWAVEYCNYHIAECLYEAGHYDGYKGKTYTYNPPAHYYGEAIKANPKSRFLLDASVKIAICLIESGKLQEAEKAFMEAQAAIKRYREDTAKTGDMNYRESANRAESLIKLARAKQLERKADQEKTPHDQALQAFKDCQSTSRALKFFEVAAEATEGEMRVLVKDRQFGEARIRAQEIIDKYKKDCDPNLLGMLPVAYTVMARASLAQANEYEGKNQPVQAQLAYAEARWNYLQVLVQFFDKDEYVAEAGYFAGLCNEKLKDQEADARENATQCWLDVKKNFPTSPFAEMAAADLKRMGADGEKKKGEGTKDEPKKGEAKKDEAKTPPKKSSQ